MFVASSAASLAFLLPRFVLALPSLLSPGHCFQPWVLCHCFLSKWDVQDLEHHRLRGGSNSGSVMFALLRGVGPRDGRAIGVVLDDQMLLLQLLGVENKKGLWCPILRCWKAMPPTTSARQPRVVRPKQAPPGAGDEKMVTPLVKEEKVKNRECRNKRQPYSAAY